MTAPPGPTEYVSSPRNATLVQEGTASRPIVTWTDGPPSYVAYPVAGFHSYLGLRYNIFDATAVSKRTISSLTLVITATVAPPIAFGEVAIALFESATDYGTFTAGNLPQYPIGALAGTGWKYYGTDDGTGWVGDTISVQLGNLTTDIVTGTTFYSLDNEFYMIQEPTASGILALSVIFNTALSAPVVNTTLVVGDVPYNTGMMVGAGDLQRRARVVHSYKSGFPYLSDEAIPDGYTDGIMVHPDDYDPIDPVAQGTGEYVPSPTEGVVDDEVTDLED